MTTMTFKGKPFDKPKGQATLAPATYLGAGVGTAHVSAAEIKLPIKGNRLKLLWATVCPWKREIRISVPAAGIYIADPPQQNDQKPNQPEGTPAVADQRLVKPPGVTLENVIAEQFQFICKAAEKLSHVGLSFRLHVMRGSFDDFDRNLLQLEKMFNDAGHFGYRHPQSPLSKRRSSD